MKSKERKKYTPCGVLIKQSNTIAQTTAITMFFNVALLRATHVRS